VSTRPAFDHHAFAAELARCGGLPARLLELHVDDGTGRCRICSQGGQTGRDRHPCRLRALATEALVIQGRQHMDGEGRPPWLKKRSRGSGEP
jgi:hypothetical protein